jgi:hypothetical protein
MPTKAHGLTEDEFYKLLIRYEPTMICTDAPAAWMRFCNWVCR